MWHDALFDSTDHRHLYNFVNLQRKEAVMELVGYEARHATSKQFGKL